MKLEEFLKSLTFKQWLMLGVLFPVLCFSTGGFIAGGIVAGFLVLGVASFIGLCVVGMIYEGMSGR